MAKTRNFANVIRQQLVSDSALQQSVEKALLASHVATLIYETRRDAGLTQAEMARRVGSHQSVIARLEDADYEGHSLTMLLKIAAALDCRVKLAFEPLDAVDADMGNGVRQRSVALEPDVRVAGNKSASMKQLPKKRAKPPRANK